MFYRLGDDHAVVIGSATNIVSKRVGQKNRPITTFSVAYSYNRETDEKQYLNCTAWNDLSDKYLNRLDRGDIVMCFGTLEKDEYWSERNKKDEFRLIVEFAMVQPMFEDSFETGDDIDLSEL